MPMTRIPESLEKELSRTAHAICTPGKGILAADESTGTIGSRFSKVQIENNESNRATYRSLLFNTPCLSDHISGVILYEETLFQKCPCTDQSMVDVLKSHGIIPGIKVDCGLTSIPNSTDEKATKGLDDLSERCAKFYKQGARFSKWRAVLSINKEMRYPSELSITETAHTLARYATISQANGLVPIVEPEILSDGNHDIEYCAEVTQKVLCKVVEYLHIHGVFLEGCLLKPNMVTPGVGHPERNSCASEVIAKFTLQTLRRTIPPSMVGIVFLSGGQSEEDASRNLNAMNSVGDKHRNPWVLTFSYGRALQASAIETWGGILAHKEQAQKVLLARAKANGEAQLGNYLGGAGSGESLFVKDYKY